MSGRSPAPGRPEVIALLAQHDECAPGDVGDRIDSLQLAWLVHVVEERYGIRIDLDEELEAMDTVDGAVAVLAGALAAPVPGGSGS
ncbi:acyl carrier protein (plasmid) [Streptomyces sp. DSM 116496]|uniref:acyl carrier protein n=1 Tax=Streptomyces stoeckheimensis TaxID=3344656 RepID=UPI0038B3B7EC